MSIEGYIGFQCGEILRGVVLGATLIVFCRFEQMLNGQQEIGGTFQLS
ncbi:hypothetical protein BDSB_01455 [Burkholderia dolosa PC543]|nr:hypothetical protein BDSB_01455 [Burkholderia dolosa PC543]